jgi:nitroreductase
MSAPDPTIAALILQRRTVRQFDRDRTIPATLLRHLLELAAHAPSGHNLQPWRFVVVTSPRNRRRLRAAAYGHPTLIEAPVALIALGAQHPERSHLDEILAQKAMRQGDTPDETAALRGKILADRHRGHDPATWSLRGTMLAVGTLILAAEGLGLGTCLVESFAEDRLRQDFGIPDDHTVACLLAIGYPRERPESPGRLPLSEILFDEHFGQPSTLAPPPPSD